MPDLIDVKRFAVRTIYPDSRSVNIETFEVEPTTPQAQSVCGLFGQYLSERPTEFRDKLEFVKKYNMEMEWAAAGGGCAYCAFYVDDVPVSMMVLLCGYVLREEQLMLDGLKAAILGRLLEDDADRLMDVPERPVVLHVLLPGHAELGPMLQLMTSALASVYFQAMEALLAREMGPGEA